MKKVTETIAKFSLILGALVVQAIASTPTLASTNKVKLYVIDGTKGRLEYNWAMSDLYQRYDGPKYYANGPAGDRCDECYKIMETAAKNMCYSLQSGEATHIALAGYSRGAYLARAALVKAKSLTECLGVDIESRLVWGGFVDPVPWAMRESRLVNDWGGWKKGIPGINIVKEVNTPGFWSVIDGTIYPLCKAQSFAAPHLPTVVVNSCHEYLSGNINLSGGEYMRNFLVGRLITSARTVAGMTFSLPDPFPAANPYACWEEWQQKWWFIGSWNVKCGFTKFTSR